MFDTYVFVFEFLGFVFGRNKNFVQPRGDINLIDGTGRPAHFWYLVYLALDSFFHWIYQYARPCKDRRDQPAFLIEERVQQVLDFNLLIAESSRQRLRSANSLLRLLGKSVYVHMLLLKF